MNSQSNFTKMKSFFFILLLLSLSTNCSSDNEPGTPDSPEEPGTPDTPVAQNEVDFYLTEGSGSERLQKQEGVLAFGTNNNTYSNIDIDGSKTYQSIDGYGFSLTGGSAEVINSLSSSKKQELLEKLFGSGENGISISYLRISIGASDLNATTFSYDDVPSGETDEDLSEFTLEEDMDDLIPLLKEILTINPDIKIMGSPWSPPAWMKDNKNTKGGSLLKEYYDVYAKYLVKYIQAMEAEGITIDAITPQNEPLHPGNNPSMYWAAVDQADFIANNLGPEFQSAGIETKIVIYDHNADKPEYPLTVLASDKANSYIDGSAFHLYAGDIIALSQVHQAYPNKNLYFTEQYTSKDGEFAGDLRWHLKNVIIGSTRNWSKIALEWNLANNSQFGPHTDGGCTTCKGGVTINSSNSYTENVGFYIVGHASKFVSPGSVRIDSKITGNLQNVAFKRPDGKKVLIVVNDSDSSEMFNVKYNGKWFTSSLKGGAVGTYVWE